MKKLFGILIVLVVCTSIIFGCAEPAPAPTPAPAPAPVATKATVLRLAGAWPPDDEPTKFADSFAESFNARAGGKYIMESHNSGSLIQLPESLDAVRLGTVELAMWAPGIYGALDARFTELPLFFASEEAWSAAQAELLPMYDQFISEKYNQRVLYACNTGGNEIFSNKPIQTAADMKGLLMGAFSPSMSSLIDKLGGSSVMMPFTDVFTSMQKKMIDACITVPNMAVTFGISDLAQYCTRGFFIPGSIVISINKDTFNSLPQDIQDILTEEGIRAQQIDNETMVNGYEGYTQQLRDKGVKVFDLPTEEREAWAAILQSSNEDIIAQMGDFGTQIVKLADKVNSQYRYSPIYNDFDNN